MKNLPGMYDETVRFNGIEICVDPINRARTDQSDNVMAIFYEEQPFIWEFTQDRIKLHREIANHGLSSYQKMKGGRN